MDNEVKELKKLFFVCLFVLIGTSTVLGCATFKKNYDYYSACMNDTACAAEVRNDVMVAREVTAKAVSAVPRSEDWVTLIVSNLVSTVVGIFSGIQHGKKLKKN